MQPTDLLILSTVIGNIIGWYIKNKTSWQNRIIPYVQIVIAVGKNLLAAAGLLPAGATVLGALDHTSTIQLAGFIAIYWFMLGILLDAALPIGLHSLFKNAKQQHAPKPARKR